MQDTNNNMIVIKQQQHIEHQALTKTQSGKEEKKKHTYHDGSFSNEQHVIMFISWEKKTSYQ
jgi:hypothetical protein